MKIGNKRYFLNKNVVTILFTILGIVISIAGFIAMSILFNQIVKRDIEVTNNNSRSGYYNYVLNGGE